MAYIHHKISIQDVAINDIILVGVQIANSIGLNATLLLAKVLSVKEQANRVKVIFIAGDNSCLWFDIDNCYYPANKQK